MKIILWNTSQIYIDWIRRGDIMKFEEFIELYENEGNVNKRNTFVKSHIIKSYIPLEEKDVRSQIIINNSYYDENGNFKVNSTAKHMFTFLSIVDMYTDIDINFKDGLNEYNKLDASMALDDILSMIDEKDLNEFKIVLNMKCNDMITNEYEPHSYINKQVERFGELIGATLYPIFEKIDLDKLNTILDNTFN